ncbi:MAG: hypothetical protein H7235_12175 [Bdellovibrionaceae bacterium]|nr:hypothetical protein [Pseudobdellovibrionaceae bacterium]
MEAPLHMNDSYRREETMAIQIILLQLVLLLGVYLFFKSESFQPPQNRPSFSNDKSKVETSAQPYSSRNIVDIAWSCQPTILANGEYGCAK